MIAAQAGDAAAFEHLVVELLPCVRRSVAWRVSEPVEREDVVQNIFIALHQSRHTYRSERRFGPWLAAIVRNASIDGMRARGRRSRQVCRGDVDQEAAALSREASLPAADALLERDDVRAFVNRQIDRLPENYRAVLFLRDIEEFDTEETAARLGCTPGTVRVRLHRARLALRAQIETGVSILVGSASAAVAPEPASWREPWALE